MKQAEAKIEAPVLSKEIEQAIAYGKHNRAEMFGVCLSAQNLKELSELLGRNIMDVDDLLLAARNVTTLSVNGVEGTDIVLEPYILNRLKSRCHPTEHFPDFLRARVKELLAGFAGC